jgi:hypothetical protein
LKIAHTKCLAWKQNTKSIGPIVHDCPHSHIDSAALRLHGYETYFTLHNESLGKQVTEGEHIMPMTIYFAICHFSCPDIIFLELPRTLSNGFITSLLVNAIIVGIFGIITCQTCIRITKQILVAEIKAMIRRKTNRLIQTKSDSSYLPTNGDKLALDQFSWNDGMRSIIQSMASALKCLPS